MKNAIEPHQQPTTNPLLIELVKKLYEAGYPELAEDFAEFAGVKL